MSSSKRFVEEFKIEAVKQVTKKGHSVAEVATRLGTNTHRAIGKSRGGATTEIHLTIDANGYPIDFEITGGEVHGSQVASQLIGLVEEAYYLIADKGYDSEHIREVARNHHMIPIIPRKSKSKN